MLSSLSTAYRSWAFKVTIWLLLAAIAGGLTFIVWIGATVKPTTLDTYKTGMTSSELDPLTQLKSQSPTELKTAVSPVSFDAVVKDMRNYPPEFKDSNFLKSNSNRWTVQVMNVVEHDVITDYLKGRKDRAKFNYFRIVDSNNQKRYVLTYGIFSSSQEATGTSQIVDFNLPKNVSAFAEEIRLYQAQIDEYEITEPIRDLSSKAPREVKLSSTPVMIPAPKAKPKPAPQPLKAETKKPVQPTPAKTEQPPPNRSIKKSANTNETLSVQEKRTIVNKEKEREREKARQKEREKERNREKEREKSENKAVQKSANENKETKKSNSNNDKPAVKEKSKPVVKEKEKEKPVIKEKEKEKEKPVEKPKRKEKQKTENDNHENKEKVEKIKEKPPAEKPKKEEKIWNVPPERPEKSDSMGELIKEKSE